MPPIRPRPARPAAGTVLPARDDHRDVLRHRQRRAHRRAGGFDVTVVDTTDPVLAGVPADVRGHHRRSRRHHASPMRSPTATDVVDPSPAVDVHAGERRSRSRSARRRSPAPRPTRAATAPSDTFDVTVTFRAPHTASADVAASPVDVSGTRSRPTAAARCRSRCGSFVDGVELTTGVRVPDRHAVRRRDRSRPAADLRRRPLERGAGHRRCWPVPATRSRPRSTASTAGASGSSCAAPRRPRPTKRRRPRRRAAQRRRHELTPSPPSPPNPRAQGPTRRSPRRSRTRSRTRPGRSDRTRALLVLASGA